MSNMPSGPIWFRPKRSPNSSGGYTRVDLWYFSDNGRVRFMNDHEDEWQVSREFATMDAVGRDPHTVQVHTVGDRVWCDSDLLVDIGL